MDGREIRIATLFPDLTLRVTRDEDGRFTIEGWRKLPDGLAGGTWHHIRIEDEDLMPREGRGIARGG